jgi:hypothetical protein
LGQLPATGINAVLIFPSQATIPRNIVNPVVGDTGIIVSIANSRVFVAESSAAADAGRLDIYYPVLAVLSFGPG